MTEKQPHRDSEILFQKLGNTWYAFSEIDDDVVFSALPAGIDPRTTKLELYDIIENHIKKIAAINKRSDQAVA